MLTNRINRVGSVQEMEELAFQVADSVPAATTLLLYGELGAGKTAFVQGLAKAFGVQEAVTSPTFTIASEYPVPSHASIRTLAHVDLYRLTPQQAQQDPMVQEILRRSFESDRLTIVEWADRLGENLPPQTWKLIFTHGLNEGERIVDVVQA